MRFIRLALALMIIAHAVTSSEIVFVILGGLFMFQALFDYGFCGAAGCDITDNSSNSNLMNTEEEETTFNDVK
ncbi:MAG: hypothetical protein ABI315_07605 [Bacteroidia bacterium]